MKPFFAFPLALAVSCAAIHAADPILPKGWEPRIDNQGDYLRDALHREKAQQSINQLTGQIAELLDAELFIAYVRLSDLLDDKGKAALKAEQTQWIKKRDHVVVEAARLDEGGSASPMDANLAYSDFTTKRVKTLESRLKQRSRKGV